LLCADQIGLILPVIYLLHALGSRLQDADLETRKSCTTPIESDRRREQVPLPRSAHESCTHALDSTRVKGMNAKLAKDAMWQNHVAGAGARAGDGDPRSLLRFRRLADQVQDRDGRCGGRTTGGRTFLSAFFFFF